METKKLSVDLPKELHNEFKVAVFKEGVLMTEKIIELIEKYLKKNG